MMRTSDQGTRVGARNGIRPHRRTAGGSAEKPALIAESPLVAIGDVHGCASLLERELEKYYGTGAEMVFLGDLIDRSPEPDGDRKVLERVWELKQHPELFGLSNVVVLRGNHEQMLVDALEEGEQGPATDLWEFNGGDPLNLPIFREHLKWFQELPFMAIRGQYLLVHAGVRPGVPLEEQRKDDLLWIRKPFLTKAHGLPYVVVHGHSITGTRRIDRRAHRINLDTGAFKTGVLSSLRLPSLKVAPEL